MKRRLGPLLWLGIALMLCGPLTASAAELSVKSDTIFRVFQRDTVSKSDAYVMPTYQYLQVDVSNPDKTGLSFHLYGWGRADLTDNQYYSDSTSGELLYGYVEFNQKLAHFNARLGRQRIFEGVANESLDGLRLSSDLGKHFSGSVYAGQQVALASENGRSGDSIFGGRLVNHKAGLYDLGLSYKKIQNDSVDTDKRVGVDLAAYLPHNINLHGFSNYNLINKGWAEHSYELSANIGQVSVRPYLQQFQYDDYFSTSANSANPFRFLAARNEELTILGTDLSLPLGEVWMLSGKAKHYNYKVFNDSSNYLSINALWSEEGQKQIGGEFGMMSGDAAQNDYFLMRLYSYMDKPADTNLIDFVSCDLVYVGYDKAIFGEDSSFFFSLGTGKKFKDDALEVKVSADYSNDPYFDADLRGMLTVSYNFSKSL